MKNKPLSVEPKPLSPITRWNCNRIRLNKNSLIVVNGPTGSGKTYSCISRAQEDAIALGTNFSLKTNLAFNFNDLLYKMDLEENDKPGTVFVFEEVGAFGGGASSRQWQSKANMFFNSFMQTSRHRNQIVYMNCPDFSFLEAGSRKLIHMQMEMDKINFTKKVAYARAYRIQINSRTGKFYFKNLRITHKGRRVKLSRVAIPHPGEEIAAEYEIMKRKYTDALNKEIRESGQKKLKKLSEKQQSFYDLWQKGFNIKEIAEKEGYALQTAYEHKNMILSKGYSLEKPTLRGNKG